MDNLLRKKESRFHNLELPRHRNHLASQLNDNRDEVIYKPFHECIGNILEKQGKEILSICPDIISGQSRGRIIWYCEWFRTIWPHSHAGSNFFAEVPSTASKPFSGFIFDTLKSNNFLIDKNNEFIFTDCGFLNNKKIKNEVILR